ncbi:MAG: isocitrate/isopropylmalate dehydrogenase family protein [Clostridia bacterium]|nr:isocitrate/isopropylmalate dehydrogenase family protein [Clostridia bacterium]
MTTRHRITLIPGDGIGPEITAATKLVVEASGAPVEWEEVVAGEGALAQYGTPLPEPVLESIRRNGVALKAPLTTPVGTGFRSVNVALRKELDLFANVRPARSYLGIASRYQNIDLVVVRENTEDLYAGIEHMVGEDAAESIKIITRKGSERIVRYAFDYAVKHGRRKVTVVHKANIMKCTDGLFLEVARQVAQDYPAVEFEDRIVDNMCMQLVQKPELYDVLVMPNLYGDIISDLCAGLVGGLGVAPGANIGEKYALFEPVHGSAPKYAGQNKVNPTAMILAAVMMLEHLGEAEAAGRIRQGVSRILKTGPVTYDLGGQASTMEMAEAIAREVRALASGGELLASPNG